jgi:hypothetical protein
MQRITLLEHTCKLCNAPMQLVQVKNPYLDDSEEECSNSKCIDYGTARKLLNTWAKANARLYGLASS